MKKILLQGFYGVHNLGDDYILYSILSTLDKLENCEVIIYSNGDDYAYLRNKIKKINFVTQKIQERTFKEKIQDIKESDYWVIGGGGLFPQESIATALNLLIKSVFARTCGTKMAFYGIEFNSFHKKINRIVWKLIFLLSDLVQVRNNNNAKMIKELGIDKVVGSSDVTFSLETDLEKKGQFPNYDRPYVVWSLGMPWRKEELQNPDVFKRYIKLCDLIVRSINRFTQYRHVLMPFYEEMDIGFIDDVKEKISVDYEIYGQETVDLDLKRAIFKNARFSVCMRFHSVIFSLYNEIPFCAISYSPKTSNILEELDMENRMVTLGIRKTDFFFEEFNVDEEKFYNILNKTNEEAEDLEVKEKCVRAAKLLKKKAKYSESVMINWFKNK